MFQFEYMAGFEVRASSTRQRYKEFTGKRINIDQEFKKISIHAVRYRYNSYLLMEKNKNSVEGKIQDIQHQIDELNS
jgi:hypothetical protein